MELNYRKKYASLDTCILLRIIEQDNKIQTRQAVELLLSGQDFFVEDIVIMETVYVLTKYHKPRSVIIDNLKTLLNNPQLNYNEAFFEPVFENFKTHPSLSFNDCVITASAEEKNHIPIWTFDQKFARQSVTAHLLEN